MAGQPRKRARLLAEKAYEDELLGNWMIQPPKIGDVRKGEPETRGVDPPAPVDPTAEWWRSQVVELERASKSRGEAMVHGSDAALSGQARVFGALGVPPDVASALMGISEGDFLAEYADEYGVGSATMIGQVSANLLRIATQGQDRYAVKAAVEIMHRRGGEPWRPPAQKVEVSRGAPKSNVIDSSKLTAEERETLRQILLAASERKRSPALEHDVE